MLEGVAIVVFFIAVWGVGTCTQYLYWKRVRQMIHEYAKDHVGYLGTGMCKASFTRNVFVMVLADPNGVVTECYELKGLSLWPKFESMPEMLGMSVDNLLEHLPNKKYHDAFRQAIHAIDSTRVESPDEEKCEA